MYTRVRELRERHVYSQAALALAAGINEGTIVRLEQGIGVPHPATIRKLAHALGVAPHELLTDVEGYAAARRRETTATGASR